MKARLFLVVLMIATMGTMAQKSERLPLTADSLATGNYKDVLTSFFQLAFDNLVGKNKELRFTTNPYAVMARLDTALLKDKYYYQYRHLRDLNFAFAVKLDTSYKFNGFSSAVKYALVNKRDETVSRVFLDMVSTDKRTQELFALNLDLEAFISGLDPDEQTRVRDQRTKFFTGQINFDQLDPAFRKKIEDLAKAKNAEYLLNTIQSQPTFNMKKTSDDIYDAYKEYFNNRLLWTIGISDTTYNDQFMFSNIVLTSEVVKGIDSLRTADLELNIKSALQYLDDTVKTGRDLQRSIFSFEPGINFVLKTKNTLKSYFEFKLSGSYYHTFSTLYENEKRDRLSINGTLRVRILNDIWVPLEIKYDPDTGNVFGLLNVRVNFSALNKFLNGKGK